MNICPMRVADLPAAPIVCNFAFDLALYPFTLMVSIGQDDAELTNDLKTAGVVDHVPMMIPYGGDLCPAKYCFFNNDSYLLIRMRELPTTAKHFGMLAHEVTHITNWALEEIGMKLDNSTSGEAYVYLNGWITTEIYQRLNKYY